MKKWMKAGIGMLMVALLFQTGFSVLAAMTSNDTDTPDVAQSSSIVLGEEVRTALGSMYPNHSEQAEALYKQFIVDYHVHDSHRQSIEQWIAEGEELSDILVAYAYVYHQFGVQEDIKPMLENRKQGMEWADIFSQYRETHPAFEPRAFDTELLEKLHATPGITSDDIMLADMISFVTQVAVEEIMQTKMESGSWQDMAAQAGILYGAETLPRVPIRMEQLEAYQSTTSLSEEEVVRGFVLAHKLGAAVEPVLEQMDMGMSEEAVYADILARTYSVEEG